MIPIKTDITD